MYIDSDTIIKFFAVLTALGGIIGLFLRVHKWYLNLQTLEKKFEDFKENTEDVRSCFRNEFFIHSYALLCMSKSMKAQGFNSTIDEAIKILETHLNEQAHEKVVNNH